MTKCAVCRTRFAPGDYVSLGAHFLAASAASEPGHVRWLNQSIGRERIAPIELVHRLEEVYRLPPEGLAAWIRARFIQRFFGPRPHPFVVALQHPTRATLLGYAIEHRHFLRQWVRCSALILARSESDDVVAYEIDNIRVEFGGDGDAHPSHFELLLRMGESCGVARGDLEAHTPLPTTTAALAEWGAICRNEHWVSALAAMHALELIAHRDLTGDGATVHYFDPAILTDGSIPEGARAFLREGYEADVVHAETALRLVERFAAEPGLIEDVQGTFLRSLDLFDDYLGARLERAEEYGPTG